MYRKYRNLYIDLLVYIDFCLFLLMVTLCANDGDAFSGTSRFALCYSTFYLFLFNFSISPTILLGSHTLNLSISTSLMVSINKPVFVFL